MENIVDVAAAILNECGNLSTMKLQKLAFYSQAYHLVNFHEPLFPEDFEAWVNGPVAPELFDRHRGIFVIAPGDLGETRISDLDARAQVSVKQVLYCLGEKTGQELSQLTHSENPWKDARVGVAHGQRSKNVIAKRNILRFYSSAEARKNCVFA